MPEVVFTPATDVVNGSLTITALLGLLPLAVFFVLLGGLRVKAYRAALGSLLVAILVAWLGYGMPLSLSLLSATEGAAFGLFPILWIVLMAVWFYKITEVSGRTKDLRDIFSVLGQGDLRVQGILIAFCFGAILEALAGFGAPVAIVASLLIALGFNPIKAAVITLIANTAPVAFGAMGTPVTTAGALLSGPDKIANAQAVAEGVVTQIPWIAIFVPLILCAILDGKRGVKQLWPFALVVGIFFAGTQYLSAHHLSYELADITSGIMGFVGAMLLFVVWKPKTPEDVVTQKSTSLTGSKAWMALFPYLLVIVIFAVSKLVGPVAKALSVGNFKVQWPGLYGHILTATGEPSTNAIVGFATLSNPGTLLLISGIIVTIVYTVWNNKGEYKLGAGTSVKTLGQVFVNNRHAIMTITTVLALAYVMNLSGQTVAIGTWLAGTGQLFVAFSPVLGWIGTAVTGSDTSANALFTALQEAAAHKLGVDPHICAAANTAGGVIGKVVSPQNLSIASAAINQPGTESTLLRKVAPISIAMLIAICIIVTIHSGILF